MKKLFFLLMLLAFFSFISCQDVLECIINKRPELSNRTLAIAQVNQFYSETITSDIKNEAFDNSYDYYFNIDGVLPNGINYKIDYRNVILEGTPLVSGTYNFTVRLRVKQSNNYSDDCTSKLNDCDGLCEETTNKTYTLLVN